METIKNTKMKHTEKRELNDLLNKIIPITVYRGTLCEKLIGGFRVLGQTVSTPEQVDDVINKSLKNLENSIR